jgi:tetraacyldisaccharide 4'-kinase
LSLLQSDSFWVVGYPLSVLWAGVTRLRRRTIGARARQVPNAKTVVVGNLHSGGSGKTPLVAAIAEKFAGSKPAIVSRGYRGKLSAAGARVDLENPKGAADYGDEPWMLAHRKSAPVFIGAKRAKALQRAEKETAPGFLLLDDAFQNFSFRHDINLVCIQTDRPLEQAYCLPLGELREPLSALSAASAVVLVQGSDALSHARWKMFLTQECSGKPVFSATLQTLGIWGEQGKVQVSGSLVWGAFSGIARPAAFAACLRGVVEPAFHHAFADHQEYGAKEMDLIGALQKAHGAHHLLTTEKDWHKARPLLAERSQALFYLRIGYALPDEFWYFLQTHLETA